MSPAVNDQNTASLNGRFYKLARPVQRDLISHQPPKISMGPYTKDDNPIVSSITWSRLTNGLGAETIETQADYTRAYYSDIPLLNGNLSGQSNIYTGAQPGGTSTPLFYAAGTSSVSYVITSNHVHTYTTIALTTVRATTGTNTDSTTGYFATAAGSTVLKPTLIVSGPSGIDHAHDLPYTGWAANSTGMEYIAGYRDLLFGMTTAGALNFTQSPASTFTAIAQLPIPPSYMRGLLVAPKPNGDDGLYAITRRGLFAYDDETEQFRDVGLKFAASPATGEAFCKHQGNIYIANGLSLIEYNPQAGTQRDVGLTKNGIVDVNYRGVINGLVGEAASLFAQVTNNGYPANCGMYKWDGRVWDVVETNLSLSSTLSFPSRPAIINNWVDNGEVLQQLHYAQNQTGRITRFPPDGLDPSVTSTSVSVAGSSMLLVLPWVKKDTDQTWLALQLQADIFAPGSTQSIELAYGLDYSSAFTSLGRSSATTEVTYNLTTATSTATYQGIQFKAIRFRARFAAGANQNNLVQLRRLTFVYKKTFRTLWAFNLAIDARENSPTGHTPREQREALEAVAASGNLVEFMFKNETDDTETHWVHILEIKGEEETGSREQGRWLVTVAEAV